MLKLENLSVAVQGKVILTGVNLHIRPGEVHVLFGQNGSGKSTLVGAIMGFSRYQITGGRIYFHGQDITEMPVYERARLGIGVMVQRPPTVKGVTVRQLIAICGKNAVDVDGLASMVHMQDFLERGVNDGFSGGEIKRSELLQLMAQKPDLLLLDEPESGVDIENIAVVGRGVNYILERGDIAGHNLRNRRDKRKKSGLIITHTGYILQYVPADVAHVLYGGMISCNGNPQEMLGCIQTVGYEKCIACARGES